MFTYRRLVTLRDADAAGFLFFARHFAFAHEAYEALMADKGVSFANMARNPDATFILPIVHAESDYRVPLWLGETITIRVIVDEIRSRRFALSYELCNETGQVGCRVKTIHVAVDKRTGKAIPLPPTVSEALRSAQDPPEAAV